MHKITKTFELEHKDYCNGCPCLDYEYNNFMRSYHYKCILKHKLMPIGIKDEQNVIRPDICKESEAGNDR